MWTPGSAVPLRRAAAFLSRPDTPLMPCDKHRGGPVSPGVSGRFAAWHIALCSPRECTTVVFSRLPSFLCHCTAPAQLIGYDRALCGGGRLLWVRYIIGSRCPLQTGCSWRVSGVSSGSSYLLYIYHDSLPCWPPFYTQQYQSSMHCCAASPTGR